MAHKIIISSMLDEASQNFLYEGMKTPEKVVSLDDFIEYIRNAVTEYIHTIYSKETTEVLMDIGMAEDFNLKNIVENIIDKCNDKTVVDSDIMCSEKIYISAVVVSK